MAEKTTPIQRISGKFKVVGAVLMATGLVAALAGAWWGGAMLFPAIAILFLGQWFED